MLLFAFASLSVISAFSVAALLVAESQNRLLSPEHLRELIAGFANLKERLSFGEVEPRFETGAGLALGYRVVKRSADEIEHRLAFSLRGVAPPHACAATLAFVLVERLGLEPASVTLTLRRTARAVEVGLVLSAEEHAATRSRIITMPSRQELAESGKRSSEIWEFRRRRQPRWRARL